jgi:hypothetical protein
VSEERSLSRPDWSRKLPRPLKIPSVMDLKTLADVRELIEKHLPAETRAKSSWQHVASCLEEAAQGGDTVDVAIALQMVLSMEGVECRPK